MAHLRATNLRFKERFAYVEEGAREQGKKLQEMTLDEWRSCGKRRSDSYSMSLSMQPLSP